MYKVCLIYIFLMPEKIQIKFTKKQWEQLRNEKEELGSSINSIVRRAVNEYFLKENN